MVQPAALSDIDTLFNALADFGVEAFAEVLRRHADAQAFCASVAFGRVVRYRSRRTGRVVGVVAGNHAKQGGSIAHVAGEGSNAIERRSKSDESIAGDAAIGGQNANHSAEAGGLADRAAGIGAERRDGHIGRHSCGRSTAGTARNALGIDRIAHRPVGGVFVRRAHGKLVAVELAEKHGAGRLKLR